MSQLTIPGRLVFAFDPVPEKGQGEAYVLDQLLRTADELHGLGICFKLNSVARACGHRIFAELRSRKLKVFGDYKFFDTDGTIANDAKLLVPQRPYIVTVASDAGVKSMQAVRKYLPKSTIVAGITMLTHLTDNEVREMHGYDTAVMGVQARAGLIKKAGLTCLVCAPKEVPLVREGHGDYFTVITPNVRYPDQAIVGENQNLDRALTPFDAIKSGSDLIVMGKPIMQAKSRRDKVKQIIDDMARAA